MDAAERNRTAPEGGAVDTSDTVPGERERAPAQEVIDSDIPNQTQDRRRRVDVLHVAFIAEKEIVNGGILESGIRR